MNETVARAAHSRFSWPLWLDYHEADDLVDFAEHMNHTRITKRVSSDIVNTIIIEARKEAKDSCNSTAHIDERVVENFRRIATREQA